MIVDGTNLATVGLIVQSRQRSRSTTRIRQIIESAPFAYKGTWLGRQGATPKAVDLRGVLARDTLADLRSAMDELNWRLRPQEDHLLEWSDDDSREWVVKFEEVRFSGIRSAPEWVRPEVNVEIRMIAEDPRGRNPVEQDETTSGAAPLLLQFSSIGNAPMPVVLEITGNNGAALDIPTIEYRDDGDVVLRTFTIDATLDGTDQLVIDTGRGTVELNGSSVIDDLTGDSPVFEVDPNDGDFPGAAPANRPDLRLTAASGSSDEFKVLYRERYWN